MFKAGKYKKQFQYKSFAPSFTNNKLYSLTDSKMPLLLEEARGYLGELNAYATLVPEIDFYIKMHIQKEADRHCCKFERGIDILVNCLTFLIRWNFNFDSFSYSPSQ